MKKALSLVLVILMAVTAFSFAAADEPTFDGEILIGVPVPMSGAGAYLGGYIFNAVELEANRINAAGGILGKKIVLKSLDDELNAEKALTCVRQLIADGAVCIIGPAYTTSAIATKDVVTESKVIQLLPNVTGTAALVDAPYTFRLQEPESLRYPD